MVSGNAASGLLLYSAGCSLKRFPSNRFLVRLNFDSAGAFHPDSFSSALLLASFELAAIAVSLRCSARISQSFPRARRFAFRFSASILLVPSDPSSGNSIEFSRDPEVAVPNFGVFRDREFFQDPRTSQANEMIKKQESINFIAHDARITSNSCRGAFNVD
jgi:hypothetical protein